MTAELFDRLLYTDCKPGTGRGAGGGFQVQAQSSGVDSAQSNQAVSWLLYEVQLSWLNQRRPVEDFPLGFAHVGGEGYGTAQSRYLGKVATGGRDGNHLADCLLTRDLDRYGPVRPAQLWRSGLWRAEPWDSKECPQFDAAELEPGPLTVDAVADWVRSVPERGPVLTRLLSVLEDPDGHRVVIVADDPDEAMSWIAAATLLLPSRQALGVSFKVFSSAPVDAKHRIVAAPAALFPRIAPGLVSQRFVLDARTGAADEAKTSERAAFFAGRFAAADEDPYDVVDAVELTDALGGGRDAMLTAWALTRPGQPHPGPDALFRWLAGTGPALISEHGPAVAAMILDASPSAKALRWLDDAAAGQRLDIDPAAVRAQLLTAELAEIREGQPGPVERVLPSARLDASTQRDAESELSSALLLGSDQQADLLLCLARRHGIQPELAPPLQHRLGEFVTGWINHPAEYHPDSWALRPQILNYAHDVLRDRMAEAGLPGVANAVKRLNRHFADRADLAEPLDCYIQASRIVGLDRAARVRRLTQLLDGVSDLAQTQPRRAAVAAAELQRALIACDAIDGEIAVTLLTKLPDSVDIEPMIAERAAGQLAKMSAKPSSGLLDLLASLDRRGKAPKSGQLANVLEADRSVQAFLRGTADDRLMTDTKYFNRTVAHLGEADAAVIRARLKQILAACRESRNPNLAPAVLAAVKPGLARLLVDMWADSLVQRDLRGRDLVDDGLWLVRCLDDQHLPQKVAEHLEAAVRQFASQIPPQYADNWYADVRRELWPGQQQVWDDLFAQDAPRKRRNLWINRDGGR
jgi:GTPase-associated protein 1, N-terminal domain type 2/GTPase-associated protein 1, middle domain